MVQDEEKVAEINKRLSKAVANIPRRISASLRKCVGRKNIFWFGLKLSLLGGKTLVNSGNQMRITKGNLFIRLENLSGRHAGGCIHRRRTVQLRFTT